MSIRRIKQVWKYGKVHASQIAFEYPEVKQRKIFLDILYCYYKYSMWSNQYKKEKFWMLTRKDRENIGQKYRDNNIDRERWLDDYSENHRFLNKWKSYKWEGTATLRNKKIKAYQKKYGIGEGCQIADNVILERHHYKWGTIKVGKHVNLSRNVYIDYTGEVIIEDGVKITNGVIIESHHRDLEAYNDGKDVNIPTKLLIREHAYIGSRAIILDSCNYIGKNSRIGAGAVVTKDIPDYSVAVGVPAKVVKVLPHNEK